MKMTLAAAAAATMMALAAVPATAGTCGTSTFGNTTFGVGDGDMCTFGPIFRFAGGVEGEGGAGSSMTQFTSNTDPLDATVLLTIGPIQLGGFQDLTVSWLGSDGMTVLATDDVEGDTTLPTTFTAPNLMQYVVFSWTDSADGADFDWEVSAVPVPASILLLGSAMAGLGLLGRRRKDV